MKKILFIAIIALSLTIGSTARASEKAQIAKTADGIQVSFTLSDEAQAQDFITALNVVMTEKAVPAPVEKEPMFSVEKMKNIFKSDVFKNLGSKLAKILIILGIAIIAKRVMKVALKLALTKVDGQKKLTKKQKQKANTILPIVDNILDVVIVILTALVILSELGIDIAPLLAGAGVIGLAIGFGAQTLVKDFITGFFILLEGTLSVGDIVTISGISGGVEDISIKSVVLRDFSGVVHTIPFSEVTTISNMTKDYSYHVFEIGVGYRENTDEVTKEINKIGKAMYKDKELSKSLLSDEIEICGVNALADSSVNIKGRIKTKPGEQWAVGRELNRRVKLRFDELGIEIPYPHTTIYFGEDKKGNAPAANVKVEK